MAAPTSEAVFLIKDVKPGSKNLNIVFIVLEIGKLLDHESRSTLHIPSTRVFFFLKGPVAALLVTYVGFSILKINFLNEICNIYGQHLGHLSC